MSLLRRLLCRHRWVTTMANVEVESGSTDMLTVCSHHCPKCAAFKLEWIFPNKDLMERARNGEQ